MYQPLPVAGLSWRKLFQCANLLHETVESRAIASDHKMILKREIKKRYDSESLSKTRIFEQKENLLSSDQTVESLAIWGN